MRHPHTLRVACRSSSPQNARCSYTLRVFFTHSLPNTPHLSHFAGLPHALRVGFCLPTRFRGLRDYGTTRQRDDETAGLLDCGTTRRYPSPKKHTPPLPHCGSSSLTYRYKKDERLLLQSLVSNLVLHCARLSNFYR